jgi:hypothetical protein
LVISLPRDDPSPPEAYARHDSLLKHRVYRQAPDL